MKRLAILAILALAACQSEPEHHLKLTFDGSGHDVTIEASTSLPDNEHATDRAAVQELRDALLAGRDEWSVRFEHAAPENDHVALDRTKGELVNVTHSATIDAGDLQKFFFDVPMTTTVLRGDGWTELTIIPGTSTRATREQREEYENQLVRAATLIIRYLDSLRTLYTYLDQHPERTTAVWTYIAKHDPDKDTRADASDEPPLPQVTKVEADLECELKEALGAILELDFKSFALDASLVEDPFPAPIAVHVPSETLLMEGFEREGDDLVIQPRSLTTAVLGLEGRWVSPDPIAMADRKVEDFIAVFASTPHHVAPVVGTDEIIEALRQAMRPAPRYRVRFVTPAPQPSS